MSKQFDLEAMSTDEMWRLHEEIIRVLSVKLTSEKRALEKRLAQLRSQKMEKPRLTSASRQLRKAIASKRRKYPKVFPKYQNPTQPSETWSGRGKKPRWLTAALNAGREIEEFVISNLEMNENNRGPRWSRPAAE
jgi:DNA-binding protein H-NS